MKLDSNDAVAMVGNETYREMTAEKVEEIPATLAKRVKPVDLLCLDTSHDPACLLGRRWICRGGACIWTGPSGAGKSALLMQAASMWACGFHFFGIQPAGPLKSMIIQAENDDMDLAEEMKGVVNGLKIADYADKINENIDIFTINDKFGPKFPPLLRALAAIIKPDLVWIDPLMTFLGGGISDDKIVTPFIRGGLDPIAKEFNFAYMINHHIPKPRVDAKLSNWTTSDYSYAGIGSSELTNWPRAAMHLKRLEDTKYELMATKRGSRAGLLPPPIVDEFGNTNQPGQVDSTEIEWADDGIYWRYSDKSQIAETQISDEEICEVLPDKWITKTRFIDKLIESKELKLHQARRIIESLFERYDLFDLTKEDGEKRVNGLFVFKVGPKGVFFKNAEK